MRPRSFCSSTGWRGPHRDTPAQAPARATHQHLGRCDCRRTPTGVDRQRRSHRRHPEQEWVGDRLMAIAGRASVSPRSAPITASPSTSRLPTVSNRGLTSTMPRGFFEWRLEHSGLRRKLVRSRHSTLCRTVPGSSAVPFSPQRRRVPSPNAHARAQGTPRDCIPISKACSLQ